MRKISLASLACTSILLFSLSYGYATPQNVAGNFWLFESSDPITDLDTSTIVTPSEEDEDVYLGFKCEGKTLNVAVSTDQSLPDEYISVTYRLDKNDAIESSNWTGSTTGTSAFMPMNMIDGFVSSAIISRVAIFRVYDISNRFKTVNFELNGLSVALKRLKCYRS